MHGTVEINTNPLNHPIALQVRNTLFRQKTIKVRGMTSFFTRLLSIFKYTLIYNLCAFQTFASILPSQETIVCNRLRREVCNWIGAELAVLYLPR
jgi:hypothetical protein